MTKIRAPFPGFAGFLPADIRADGESALPGRHAPQPAACAWLRSRNSKRGGTGMDGNGGVKGMKGVKGISHGGVEGFGSQI